MTSYLTFIHALSALHPGTGQGSGVIDLPIAREKATGLPYVSGSSLKGTLRTACQETIALNGKTIKREQLFGSEEITDNSAMAGTIQITDQRLLLLPVRSLAGTFAWVTSPYVLYRLARDMAELGYPKLSVPKIENIERAQVISDSKVPAENCQLFAKDDEVYLEDLDLRAEKDGLVRQWAEWLAQHIFREEDERRLLRQRFCVVHDDLFSFLLKTATEIIARIRLSEDSKTVKKGGLWYEEALPTESVLSGLALAAPRRRKEGQDELTGKEIGQALQSLTGKTFQLGGKSTVGRGQCRVLLVQEVAQHANS